MWSRAGAGILHRQPPPGTNHRPHCDALLRFLSTKTKHTAGMRRAPQAGRGKTLAAWRRLHGRSAAGAHAHATDLYVGLLGFR